MEMMVSGAKLRCGGDTHPGRVRSNNEDRFYCDPDRGIFLVIDGVGGQAAGEKAAGIALNMICNRLERQTGTASERVREAIALANNEIFRLAAGNPEWDGMACVLTVLLVEDGSAVAGHVGDTRLYEIRAGRIRKITHDHSPIGEREDSNDISEIEAMRHPRRNEVYRDVGSEEHTPDDPGFIEIASFDFEPDSALLLCSDGLSDQVTSVEILGAVERNAGNPQGAAAELIDAANRAGGKDNVSIVIVEGSEFAAQTPNAPPPETAETRFTGRWPMALYGFGAGILLLAASQWHFGFLDTARPAPAPAGPRMLTVGGSSDAQFRTIQDALAQARAGDTVELLAGEYREQVRLREGVKLASRVPYAAMIGAPPASPGPPIAIIAENLKSGGIFGVRILATPDMPIATGILLTDADIEIDDSEIAGATIGIEIRGAGSPRIRANNIHDSLAEGIRISGAATPWLSHNEIARNGRAARARRPGILVMNPARPALIGNIFTDNGADAFVIPSDMDGAPILKYNFFIKPSAGRRP